MGRTRKRAHLGYGQRWEETARAYERKAEGREIRRGEGGNEQRYAERPAHGPRDLLLKQCGLEQSTSDVERGQLTHGQVMASQSVGA